VNVELAERLKRRTKEFGLRVIRLFRALPKSGEALVIGRQLLRSGTSVGANYRAVCRARSRAEFIAKMGVVIEEADESLYWLEMLEDAGVLSKTRLGPLKTEANELVAIFVAARQTARNNQNSKFKPRN
jgi:four helix bundle protein